ncbi:MAG: FliM/FliN family flagellar motor switch protein [Planctomycetota bacterium]
MIAPPTALSLDELLGKYPNLRAVLDVPLSVIAILAQKELMLGQVLALDIDSVIVFSKHNSDPITFLVNNVVVGSGKTIKVGDHFGLHLRNYSQEQVVRAVGV